MSSFIGSSFEMDLFDESMEATCSKMDSLEKDNCLESFRKEYLKFLQQKSFLQAIEDYSNEESDLAGKVKSILLSSELKSQCCLSDIAGAKDNLDNVLGVPLDYADLSYLDSIKLQTAIRAPLEKILAAARPENLDQELSTDLTEVDCLLLESLKELDAHKDLYQKKQEELLQVLEELTDFRLKTLPKLIQQKYEECKLTSDMNYSKSKIVRLKCLRDCLMESKESFEAYQELLKDLVAFENSVTSDIQKLKDLKEKYASVRCKEYDDILKTYLQLKALYEKKKLMYELMK